jgi:hypothetical protein
MLGRTAFGDGFQQAPAVLLPGCLACKSTMQSRNKAKQTNARLQPSQVGHHSHNGSHTSHSADVGPCRRGRSPASSPRSGAASNCRPPCGHRAHGCGAAYRACGGMAAGREARAVSVSMTVVSKADPSRNAPLYPVQKVTNIWAPSPSQESPTPLRSRSAGAPSCRPVVCASNTQRPSSLTTSAGGSPSGCSSPAPAPAFAVNSRSVSCACACPWHPHGAWAPAHTGR